MGHEFKNGWSIKIARQSHQHEIDIIVYRRLCDGGRFQQPFNDTPIKLQQHHQTSQINRIARDCNNNSNKLGPFSLKITNPSIKRTSKRPKNGSHAVHFSLEADMVAVHIVHGRSFDATGSGTIITDTACDDSDCLCFVASNAQSHTRDMPPNPEKKAVRAQFPRSPDCMSAINGDFVQLARINWKLGL